MLKFYNLDNYPVKITGLKKVRKLEKYYQPQKKELKLYTQIF